MNLGSCIFKMWSLEMLKRWSKWMVQSPFFHKCSCPPWKKKKNNWRSTYCSIHCPSLASSYMSSVIKLYFFYVSNQRPCQEDSHHLIAKWQDTTLDSDSLQNWVLKRHSLNMQKSIYFQGLQFVFILMTESEILYPFVLWGVTSSCKTLSMHIQYL